MTSGHTAPRSRPNGARPAAPAPTLTTVRPDDGTNALIDRIGDVLTEWGTVRDHALGLLPAGLAARTRR